MSEKKLSLTEIVKLSFILHLLNHPSLLFIYLFVTIFSSDTMLSSSRKPFLFTSLFHYSLALP